MYTPPAGQSSLNPADYHGSRHYGKGGQPSRGLDENDYCKDDVFLTETLTREAIKRLEAVRNNPKVFYLYMVSIAPPDEFACAKRFAAAYKKPEDGHQWPPTEKALFRV